MPKRLPLSTQTARRRRKAIGKTVASLDPPAGSLGSETNVPVQPQQVCSNSDQAGKSCDPPGFSQDSNPNGSAQVQQQTTTSHQGDTSVNSPPPCKRQRRQHNQPNPDSVAYRVSSRSREHNQLKPVKTQPKYDDMTRVILLRRQREQLSQTYNVARITQQESEVQCHNIGQMDKLCEYCGAKLFSCELSSNSASLCCHKGKVSLPKLQVPQCLQDLIEKNDQMTQNYLEHIREYNNAFAFASVSVALVNVPVWGSSCFKVHDQTYHFVEHSNVPKGRSPSHSFMFIIDCAEALECRSDHGKSSDCSSDIMKMLQEMIESNNPYVPMFSSMKDLNVPTHQLQLHFSGGNAIESRRNNLPATGNEIAAILTSHDSAPTGKFDYVVYRKATGQLTKISYLNAHSDPMCYPLLFPCGDVGWQPGMPHVEIHRTSTRQVTSQLQYYCYMLAQREGFSLIHSSGKLLQQYIVDSYMKVEGARISFIRCHQRESRPENLRGLVDFFHSNGQEKGLLPASFIGSPRNMLQHYHDAMSIVAKHGKPDIFLTFTANPMWSEITSNLKPYETVQGRPDLVTRVFYSKLMSLLDDLQKDRILGIVTAYVDVIEFQEKGLPQVHMLIILRSEDKIQKAAEVDSIVSAEIPNEQGNDRLHAIIKQFMIHGPCGNFNPQSRCMVDGKCSKGFPREFSATTALNVNGYPHYRRRNDGNTVQMGDYIVDNRWVVPYNAYLCLKYEAHINVEICSSIRSVNYLYKYVYKGNKSTTVQMRTDPERQHASDINEIQMFLDARYVSPLEAMWRLHERHFVNKSHIVTRLPVHLPEEQFVVLQSMEEAEENPDKDTRLTAFFKLCQQDEAARQYLYSEIPEFYAWNKNEWIPRKRFNKCFGRMFTVNIADKERFSLRLLLLHIKGPQSFQDLRTVSGVTHQTFSEAAASMNLLSNDDEWIYCIEEAFVFQMPRQLRQLFAIVCVFGPAHIVPQLWERFKGELSDDYTKLNSIEDSYGKALANINSILLQHGKSYEDFNLPTPSSEPDIVADQEMDCEDQHFAAQADVFFNLLNTEQKNIVEEVLQAIAWKSQTSFFIDGPGGTGKTFLYNALASFLLSQNKTVLSVAWTGLAARLLPKGRTCHDLFKLPFPLLDTSVSGVSPNSEEAQDLKNASLIIWDEVSIVPAQALPVIDRLLRELTKVNAPFGGKIILFGGDFRQVLPEVQSGNRTDIVASTVKNSPLWKHVVVRKLKTNMRASEDQRYADWLLLLGEAQLPNEDSVTSESIAIPKYCFCFKPDLITTIFNVPKIDESNIHQFQNTAILCPTIEDCLEINDSIVTTLIEGETRTYYSADSVTCENKRDETMYPPEFLHSLNPPGLPPHKLTLKKHAIIMLIRNLNSDQGLVDGTRLIVQQLHKQIIIARVIDTDKVVIIPRINLSPTDPTMPFSLNRKQFPIDVAFAIPISKAQGQTLNKAGLYLPKPVFSHGQLYAAFSRVRNFASVKVAIVEGPQQQIRDDKIITSNVVFKEVL